MLSGLLSTTLLSLHSSILIWYRQLIFSVLPALAIVEHSTAMLHCMPSSTSVEMHGWCCRLRYAIRKPRVCGTVANCKEDDGSLTMIVCDHCLEWFHWHCVGLNKRSLHVIGYNPGSINRTDSSYMRISWMHCRVSTVLFRLICILECG